MEPGTPDIFHNELAKFTVKGELPSFLTITSSLTSPSSPQNIQFTNDAFKIGRKNRSGIFKNICD